MKSISFEGKRVFVTGHTGFKGSWLLVLLNHLKCKVQGYALNPRRNEMFDLIDGRNLCNHDVGDVRNKKKLERAILEFRPDIIFHLAAQPLVLASYDDPEETITSNYVGTFNLLEVLRKNQLVAPCIIVTTDKVYRNEGLGVSFSEDDPLGGSDIYSGSKAAIEIMAASYASSFNLNVVTARAGNVIGGGDFAENRIVPDIIRAYEGKKTLYVRNPESVRPWQHVLESLLGYLKYSEALIVGHKIPKSLNFGPKSDDFSSVNHLIDVFNSHLDDHKINKVNCENSNTKESNFLTLNSSLAIETLGWQPRWNLNETIKNTIEWYLAKNKDKRRVTEEQVRLYLEQS